MSLIITSTAFKTGGEIPQRHTGDGEDLSPLLQWEGLPPGTVELALLVDDPDAPVAEPWVHWVLYRIPPTCAGLPAGFHSAIVPPGLGGLLQGLNSWGTVGYRGPAPPKGHGKHHYHFRLMALDHALDLPAGADKKRLLEAASGHILAQAELVGTYSR